MFERHYSYPTLVSEEGIVAGTEKVFVGVKNARDYHDEMNGEHFEDYLRLVKWVSILKALCMWNTAQSCCSGNWKECKSYMAAYSKCMQTLKNWKNWYRILEFQIPIDLFKKRHFEQGWRFTQRFVQVFAAQQGNFHMSYSAKTG